MRYFKPHFKIQTPFRPPFGSCMQGRGFSSAAYRFGFNNQEKDGELGDSYAFEYRIHDARLGRFLSVDPLKMEYPWNSNYAFAENRVIDGIDVEGSEWKKVTDNAGKATGFTWDPTNAYEADGSLKDGYYKTAIYFFEKTTVPVSGDANQASGFHATARVYKTDGTTKDYDATTLPSDNEKFGTVAEGFYESKPGKHTGYAALHVMKDADKAEDWNNRSLPAENGNNPSNGSTVVVGVNIHKAGKNDYLGTYKKSDGSAGGVSEGCFTIKRGQGDILWNDFISNFTTNDRIGILLTRDPFPTPQIKPATPTTAPSKAPSSSTPSTASNSNWYDDVVDFFSNTWDTLVNGIVQTEQSLESGNAP